MRQCSESSQIRKRKVDSDACYQVTCMHQYSSRVNASLGGTLIGDLSQGKGRKASSYHTIINARSPEFLNPIARQQISSAWKLDRSACSLTVAVDDSCVLLKEITKNEADEVYLRVDTLPKSQGEAVSKLIISLLEISIDIDDADADIS